MSELPEWARSLPEEMHDAPHVRSSKTAAEYVQHSRNDAAWRGQSIRIPGADADESVMQEFHNNLREKVPSLMPTPMDDESTGIVYSQMGKPKEAADYAVPEGVEIGNIDEYKAAAHALDMTQKVFDRWMQMEASGMSDRQAAISEALETQYGELKQEWGAAFDQNYTMVGEVLREAPESVVQAYQNKTLPIDQVKWLFTLAGLGDENQEVIHQRGNAVMTPEQASLELEDFKPKFYAMKKHDPGYPAAAKKFERLMKLRMGQVA